MSIPILIAMVLYMAMVIGIGFICSKKNQNQRTIFWRKRPGAMGHGNECGSFGYEQLAVNGAAGSCVCDWIQSGGMDGNWTDSGTYLNWKIIAKRLRHYTEVSENSITVPDFFSNRFKDDKKILSSISAIMILIFFTVYTASGFAACGTLFNSVFGLNYQASMIVCAAVIVIYTSLGGFLAASTTDLIQGLLMSFAIVVVLIVGIVAAGGVGSVIEYGRGLEGFFDIMKYHDPASGHAVSQGILPIVSGLAWDWGNLECLIFLCVLWQSVIRRK